MKNTGRLYLLPNLIAEGTASSALPDYNRLLIAELGHFICEHAKQLRVLLKASGLKSPYDHIEFFELNKHTNQHEISSFLKPLFEGKDMGLVSDAGCPGVADPGAQVVEIAHQKNIEVIPLVGPSSLLMALMASGFNGQQFTFNGYLPQKEKELKNKLLELERKALAGSTELFIEAPYRNQKMLDFILKSLGANTKLCIAFNIMGQNAFIKTKPVFLWRKEKLKLSKEPAVFIIGR
ncbi:MAG: SAM-dependent methyltransferase [Bacteroidia bacterium]